MIEDNGPLRAGNLHSVAVGVAAALAAIHGAGVIHRDLKPRNVLFALGTPKVIDFGIAQAFEVTSHHTRADEMVGTLAYMAPERFDPVTDRQPTPAADVFAWGAVVTYAGTGRTPFAGDSPAVTAARILTQEPRLTGLPPALAALVARALAKEPGDRPTAPELLDLLLAAGTQDQHGQPLEVRPEVRRAAEAAQHSARHPSGSTSRAGRKRRGRVIAAVATAAVLAAAAGVLVASRDDPEPQRPLPVAAPPSAPPSAPPPVPLVSGPTVFDPLTRAAEWQPLQDVAGRCAIDDGLVVTTKAGATMRCTSGAEDVFPGRQSIGVTALPGTAASCAGIWFRVTNDAAYRLAVCATSTTLGLDEDDAITPLATVARATAVGEPHRIGVVADGAEAVVSIDGAEVLRAPTTEPTLASGGIQLGATSAGGKAKVTFTDAAFRSGSAPDTPPVPAFVTRDATFTAQMWMFDSGEGSAVIEPADFRSGAEYCRRHAIEPGSAKCKEKTVADAAGLRVTMPARDVRLREYREDDPDCTDPATRAGKCATTTDRFSIWATGNSPFPALVTTKDGEVVALSQLDLP